MAKALSAPPRSIAKYIQMGRRRGGDALSSHTPLIRESSISLPRPTKARLWVLEVGIYPSRRTQLDTIRRRCVRLVWPPQGGSARRVYVRPPNRLATTNRDSRHWQRLAVCTGARFHVCVKDFGAKPAWPRTTQSRLQCWCLVPLPGAPAIYVFAGNATRSILRPSGVSMSLG